MRMIGYALLAGLMLASSASAQTLTTRTDRLAASTRAVVGATTFGSTSPLQVVGMPSTLTGTILVTDGSGNVGTPSTISGSYTLTGGLTLGGDLAVNGGDITTGGALVITSVGDVTLNPGGLDVLPGNAYTVNLGALTNKYLTLHAAELWVETLVAQNTLATIGGRILVGPTTTLTADLSSGATSITVKHNSLASGDRVYMEANGSVEFMNITSGPTGSGPYTYSVSRDQDGSGANAWSAGDALFNTGTTGSGWIDLYSVRGVRASSEKGPTIVGNVRTSTLYNAWGPRWALGNLDGLYGYSGTTYGAAFGPGTGVHVTVDATNGIRMMDGTTIRANWATSGAITVGNPDADNTGHFYVDSDSIDLRWRNNSGVTSSVFYVSNSGGDGLLSANAPAQFFDTVTIAGALQNQTASTWTISSTTTASKIHLKPGAGGYIGIDTATDFRPTSDSAILLGTSSFRWDNINLDLPNNTSPAYVVVNKGGGGGDTNSALGYVIGVSGTIVVKGSDGNNCNLVFAVGLLTSETCP